MRKRLGDLGRRGFTLLEVAVVLVVFGILIAIAAPNMGGYVRQTKLDGALRQLSGDVAYARALAVRSGRGATLAIQPGGALYVISTTESTGATRTAKRMDLAADYRGVTLAPATTVLTFNSRGLLVSPAGATDVDITARQGSTTASLKVLLTGRAFREY